MATGRRAVLSSDTSFEAEAAQVAIWRSLSTVEKANLIAGACRTIRSLAMAGLRARHPAMADRELVPRFALLTLGPKLAHRVYPELADIDPGA